MQGRWMRQEGRAIGRQERDAGGGMRQIGRAIERGEWERDAGYGTRQ